MLDTQDLQHFYVGVIQKIYEGALGEQGLTQHQTALLFMWLPMLVCKRFTELAGLSVSSHQMADQKGNWLYRQSRRYESMGSILWEGPDTENTTSLIELVEFDGDSKRGEFMWKDRRTNSKDGMHSVGYARTVFVYLGELLPRTINLVL